tara:strand:- start:794 stop:952 length:159 start_codon:yes stop_codon:yes gene_type:complete
MTLETIARMRIRAELRYQVDMKKLAEALKQGLSEKNYKLLVYFIEEQNNEQR